MDSAHVAVVGGGGTGAALAHDLVLRGLRVTLLERGELTSGTTGRHRGLLHSGARYAVADAESAVECIQENRILRRIAPGSFEENGGLFVAITDGDMDYRPGFLDACAACGIPARALTTAEALAMEPGLNPAVKAAVWVPDATMDAMRLPLRFFASAPSGRELSRTFKCFDHAVTDGVEGFVTITGGKATTLRAMAEAAADVVCASWASRPPAAPARCCSSPTPPTTPGGGRHEPEGSGEPQGGCPGRTSRGPCG